MTEEPSAENHPEGFAQRDYYALIRGRLPEKHKRASDIISKVNQVYVETGRDTALAESFSKFVVWVTAEQNHGFVGKGDAFYVTGESGAGKTDMVEHLIAHHATLAPLITPIGTLSPCISISLQGPATLSVLALRIAAAAGFPLSDKLREGRLWDKLPATLKRAGVMFIHIDEFQHLFHAGCDAEGLVKYIKGLMNNPPWPVSFIISGMPEVRNIIINDEQAERRNNSFTLPPIDISRQRALVKRIIRRLSQAADMDVKDLLASDVPERVAHAGNYQFGRICEVTISAIQEAALASDKVLNRMHFAGAYVEHSDARDRNAMNPFISDEWKLLKPGYFILPPKGDRTERLDHASE
ncbi:AAA domain-containing protein [Devosia lucknowensis]|uniref:AAA domain-containing protein n=1 Tax=Devosia lucknowensis TaxID=1096929 RepID=A0A1Y6GA30_9HYPH|nr:ATP-binding protein [Devosia lucknowensis]SMQ85287.1 AAA domain-containing protein [Devosia lucknowensis]